MSDLLKQLAQVERKQLVDLWKKHNPKALEEKSIALQPLVKIHQREPSDLPEEPDSVWTNDIYVVAFRWKTDPVFKTDGLIQLGISTRDGTARHDWREFQAIKNQLAGEECEAFELYPAESRLVDPSNYFVLWCFPGLKRIRVGVEIRDVRSPDDAIAPQRGFPAKE
jgi:hypothetical protein